MCSPWAYKAFLEYEAVFLEIAEILKASGVKAKVKDTADKTGKLIKVTVPGKRIAVLNEEGKNGNWNVDLDGNVVELDIPVENRDAKAIAAVFLKAIGK
jgi:hypothetical protein